MTRTHIEYAKAGISGLFAILALVLILTSGAPSPLYIALPVVLALGAIFFWWRADTYYKDQ